MLENKSIWKQVSGMYEESKGMSALDFWRSNLHDATACEWKKINGRVRTCLMQSQFTMAERGNPCYCVHWCYKVQAAKQKNDFNITVKHRQQQQQSILLCRLFHRSKPKVMHQFKFDTVLPCILIRKFKWRFNALVILLWQWHTFELITSFIREPHKTNWSLPFTFCHFLFIHARKGKKKHQK